MESKRPNKKNLERQEIGEIIIINDSLGDRGSFGRKKMAFFRMNQFFNLDKSPLGRFTNGRNWADHFCANIIIHLVIEHFKEEGYTQEDIVDGIIHNDEYISSYIKDSFNLNDDKCVSFFSKNLIRTYCEGGLTAARYKAFSTFNPELIAYRSSVLNLEKVREMISEDDKKFEITDVRKAETLILDWSGANDLISANKTPDKKYAKQAIEARMENIEILIKKGYRNFVLFNLPDLSLLPRYQNAKDSVKNNAQKVSTYFNETLEKYCNDLKKKYPDCFIEVFDVDKKFKAIYNNPKAYGFDPALKKDNIISSKEYVTYSQNNINLPPSSFKHPQSSQYLFWDDVHPSAALHEKLAAAYFENFMKTFRLKESKELAQTQELTQPPKLNQSQKIPKTKT